MNQILLFRGDQLVFVPFPLFPAFLHHNPVGYQGLHKDQRYAGIEEIITAFFEPANIWNHLLERESNRSLEKFTVFHEGRPGRRRTKGT